MSDITIQPCAVLINEKVSHRDQNSLWYQAVNMYMCGVKLLHGGVWPFQKQQFLGFIVLHPWWWSYLWIHSMSLCSHWSCPWHCEVHRETCLCCCRRTDPAGRSLGPAGEAVDGLLTGLGNGRHQLLKETQELVCPRTVARQSWVKVEHKVFT